MNALMRTFCFSPGTSDFIPLPHSGPFILDWLLSFPPKPQAFCGLRLCWAFSVPPGDFLDRNSF